MLTSVLPGLRQVRGPIASGGLLVATAYMLLASRIDEATDLDGSVGRGFVRLNDQLGSNGWMVVAAVAAYLIGSIYVSLTGWIAQRAAIRWTRRMLRDPELLLVPSFSNRRPFTRLSVQRLVRLHERLDGTTDDDPRHFAARVCWDIVQDEFGTRLLSTNKDLFGEYDRLRSEAEFRDSVALPMVGATVVLVANLDVTTATRVLLTFAALVLSVALSYMARTHGREARLLYAHAVVNRLVTTTTVDREPELPDPHL